MLGHTGSLKGSEGGSLRTCLFTRRRTSCCCSHSTLGSMRRKLCGPRLLSVERLNVLLWWKW